MKLKKAVRENDVDNQFLKYSTRVISPYLSDFFNWCVEQGVFPNVLKIAEIVPIYKRGSFDVEGILKEGTNYRTISLLSPFSKIFEKLIYSRLYSYLEKFILRNRHQFGFRRDTSTIHSIICNIYDKLIKNIDKNLCTCCVFLDLTKAFDSVDHSILLEKMDSRFGICDLSLKGAFKSKYLLIL